MTQLRHDYPKFQALHAEVLVMVPNGPKMIEKYIRDHAVPYPILSDKGAVAAAQYMQVKKFFVLGTPSVFLVDKTGRIAYAHYASSLLAEPGNQEPLAVLGQLAA